MNKIRTIRSFALLIALAGFWTALTQQPQAPVEFTVEKISDDLHVIVGGGGNVAVYTTPEGVILVDDKFDQHVPQILAKVRTVTSQPVRYVLNTHHHGDHTGGNQKLLAEKAELLIHKNARAHMQRLNQPGIPRITYADETAVVLGNKEVRARHFGAGHTDGDAIVFFPERKVIHTGDLFVTGTPLIDYTAGGSGVAWTETLNAAMKWEFDTVIPGHGPVMKRAELAQWIKTFETVRQRVSQLRRDGKSKEEALKSFKVEELGWTPSRMWNERSLPGLIDELAGTLDRRAL